MVPLVNGGPCLEQTSTVNKYIYMNSFFNHLTEGFLRRSIPTIYIMKCSTGLFLSICKKPAQYQPTNKPLSLPLSFL